MTGCADIVSTNPSSNPSSNPADAQPALSSASQWTPIGGVFALPTPPVMGAFGMQGATDFMATPFVLSEPERVRIRVTGQISASENPVAYDLCFQESFGTGYGCGRSPIGPIGPAGFPVNSIWHGGLAVWLRLARPGDDVWIPLRESAEDPFAVEAVIDLPPGVIEMARVGFQCTYRSRDWVTAGCYLFSGFQTMTVERLADTFQVSVACTPAVVRGQDAACSASWTPASINAGEIEFAWRFDPDSVRVFPDPTAPALDPPPSVDTIAVGLSRWSGPMVIGGRVTVRASYNGATPLDSARVSISARSGPVFGDLPVSFSSVIGDVPTDSSLSLSTQPHPDPGGGPGMVGQNFDTHTGNGALEHAIHGTPALMAVSSGPNAGYWYVRAPNVRSTRGVRMRTWLTGREAPKFRYPTVPTLLTNRGLLAIRRTHLNPHAPRLHADSTIFPEGVEAHESYGLNGAKGHQGQIELAAKSLPTCGRVPTILERVVAADSGQVDAAVGLVLDEGRKSLYAAAWHDHVHGNYANGPFYEVVATVTNAAGLSWKVALGDAPQPPHPALAPIPLYKCTRVY